MVWFPWSSLIRKEQLPLQPTGDWESAGVTRAAPPLQSGAYVKPSKFPTGEIPPLESSFYQLDAGMLVAIILLVTGGARSLQRSPGGHVRRYRGADNGLSATTALLIAFAACVLSTFAAWTQVPQSPADASA